MNGVKEISKLIDASSIVTTTEGVVAKGSLEVAEFILGSCEAYNSGFKSALFKYSVVGVIAGVTLAGASILLSKKLKNKKAKL